MVRPLTARKRSSLKAPTIYLKNSRGLLGLFGPSHDPGLATTDLVFPTSAFVTKGNSNSHMDRVYHLFHRCFINYVWKEGLVGIYLKKKSRAVVK